MDHIAPTHIIAPKVVVMTFGYRRSSPDKISGDLLFIGCHGSEEVIGTFFEAPNGAVHVKPGERLKTIIDQVEMPIRATISEAMNNPAILEGQFDFEFDQAHC